MPDRRTHLVLIPGFGGFDALGQIFYYAGVARAADRWRQKRREADMPVPTFALHFFENLPTAGVRTRAMALRAFLEERRLRNVLPQTDRIALVGHSTGGLDIRQLLVNLGMGGFGPSHRDLADPPLVADPDLLQGIERLAFLSVPQRGTNIADFIRRLREPIRALLDLTETELKVSRNGLIERLEAKFLSRFSSEQLRPQLFAALRDALAETLSPRQPTSARERYQAALARSAYGELLGWLDNVETDFFAIDDLACESAKDALPTPARYDDSERDRELQAWAKHGIATRSFATLGRCPYDRKPRTEPYGKLEIPVLLGNFRSDETAQTDFPYRFAHAATAAGPFKVAPEFSVIEDTQGNTRMLAPWENDGIVNTASMLWPNGRKTRLVHGNHGDIIGHYKPSDPFKTAEQLSGRKNHSYDILGSNSGFDDARFDDVWHDLFEFCTSA